MTPCQTRDISSGGGGGGGGGSLASLLIACFVFLENQKKNHTAIEDLMNVISSIMIANYLGSAS